jgi:hypothetical protein
VVTIAELGPVSNSTLCIRNCELSLELLRPLDMPEEVRAEEAEEAVKAVKAVPEVVGTVNTIIDARPRHVIMAEVARRRMMAVQVDSTKN